MNKNPIGRKVNLLIQKGICSWEMSNDVCEIIGVVPWSQEMNDWCQHYIIKCPDGTEKEIREVECVFSPDYSKKYIEDTIYGFLNDNGVQSEVSTQCERLIVVVNIEWGDYKHSHLWAVDLMSYLGYVKVGEVVTEEDGSDTYSAEHYFIKKV